MQRVTIVDAGRAAIMRQVAGQGPIEAEGALLDHFERGCCRDHLRDRGHLEPGLDGHRNPVTAVGQTGGVLEEGFATRPDKRYSAEQVPGGPFVDPGTEGIAIEPAHRLPRTSPRRMALNSRSSRDQSE